MKNSKRNFYQNDATGYFEELPKGTQEIINELCLETFETAGETWAGPNVESIECKRRDGFIPSSANHGGIMIRGFTDLAHFDSTGEQVAHEGARAEIERQIKYSLECAMEGFKEKYGDELKALGVTDDQINYHDLYELETKTKNKRFSSLAEELSQYEHENMNDDQSSIMYEVRFMYHGKEDGKHVASVSCAVNTEGPYHRSSISWAPGVFCEGTKETEIEWSNQTELKKVLKKALAETSKAVF